MSEESEEQISYYILSSILKNHDYARRVILYLKDDYFEHPFMEIFRITREFFAENNSIPDKDLIKYTINKNIDNMDVNKQIQDCLIKIYDVEFDSDKNFEWLLTETEDFCKKQEMKISLQECFHEMMENESSPDFGKLQESMKRPFAISFNDDDLGFELFEDAEEVYERLTKESYHIPTGFKRLDKIIGGGAKKKTLNLFCAGPGVGKTLLLGQLAKNAALEGYNVVYLSLEIIGEEISTRMHSSMTGIYMDNLIKEREMVLKSLRELAKKHPNKGKCHVKDFTTIGCSVQTLINYIKELEVRKDFVPDVIIVDYLNLLEPIVTRREGNSYEKLKKVSEELRALGYMYNCPVWSATQFNKGGMDSTDPKLSDTSDSGGIPMTVDLQISIVKPPDLDELDHVCCKLLKSRYGRNNQTFMLEIDYNTLSVSDLGNFDEDDKMNNKIKQIQLNNKIVKSNETQVKTQSYTGFK